MVPLWRRLSESNRRIREPKSRAFPLGEASVCAQRNCTGRPHVGTSCFYGPQLIKKGSHMAKMRVVKRGGVEPPTHRVMQPEPLTD